MVVAYDYHSLLCAVGVRTYSGRPIFNTLLYTPRFESYILFTSRGWYTPRFEADMRELHIICISRLIHSPALRRTCESYILFASRGWYTPHFEADMRELHIICISRLIHSPLWGGHARATYYLHLAADTLPALNQTCESYILFASRGWYTPRFGSDMRELHIICISRLIHSPLWVRHARATYYLHLAADTLPALSRICESYILFASRGWYTPLWGGHARATYYLHLAADTLSFEADMRELHIICISRLIHSPLWVGHARATYYLHLAADTLPALSRTCESYILFASRGWYTACFESDMRELHIICISRLIHSPLWGGHARATYYLHLAADTFPALSQTCESYIHIICISRLIHSPLWGGHARAIYILFASRGWYTPLWVRHARATYYLHLAADTLPVLSQTCESYLLFASRGWYTPRFESNMRELHIICISRLIHSPLWGGHARATYYLHLAADTLPALRRTCESYILFATRGWYTPRFESDMRELHIICILRLIHSPLWVRHARATYYLHLAADTLPALSRTCESYILFSSRGWYTPLFESNMRELHIICISHTGLTQVVQEATRTTANTATLIDLAMMSNPALLERCSVVPPLSNSDHNGVELVIRWSGGRNKTQPRPVWKYAQADFELACEKIQNINWDTLLDDTDIETAWQRWESTFMSVMEQCIPKGILPHKRKLPGVQCRNEMHFIASQNPTLVWEANTNSFVIKWRHRFEGRRELLYKVYL